MSLNSPLTKGLLKTTDICITRLNEGGIVTIEDLVLHLPRVYESRWEATKCIKDSDLSVGKVRLSLTLETLRDERSRWGKMLTKAVFVDDDGITMEALWFYKPFQLKTAQLGSRWILWGEAKSGYGKISLTSPEIKPASQEAPLIVPIYREIQGLSSQWFTDKIQLLRPYFAQLEDIVPEIIRIKRGLLKKADALEKLHFPKSEEEFEKARHTFAYEELWVLQGLALEKRRFMRETGRSRVAQIPLDSALMKTLIAELPFDLTGKQKIVLFQTLRDMEKDEPAYRLLQWDVGTGKTAVALLASIHAIKKSNIQVAIMAPTEILAEQHFKNHEKDFARHNISVGLLTGSVSTVNKKTIKAGIKNGSIQCLFGTHALIQDDVVWNRLGFVVVDEQHRFGVNERAILETYASHASGLVPHRLNMTATPIPRSLALTMYGEQDVSILDEYPKGRKPIITRIVRESQRTDAYKAIELEIRSGRQVYWISPLVEDSEEINAASAISTYELLQQVFPSHRIGLVHGRMSGRDKEAVMQQFYRGEIDILSSTTVIEVGVNCPNASVIVIEAAERFGLSQLHQLRWRVGRGEYESFCFLFTTKSYVGERLRAIEKTQDGFELSEIDLELRGPGEVYGVRQSGVLELRVADFRDIEMIEEIREDLKEITLDK